MSTVKESKLVEDWPLTISDLGDAATASFSSAMPTLVLTSQPPEEGGNKQQQMATAGSSAGPNPLDQVPSSSVPATVTRCRPPKLDIPPAISATAVHSEQSQEESNGGLVFITIIPVCDFHMKI